MKGCQRLDCQSGQRGFSFLELSLVLLVIALLTASVSYAVTSTVESRSRAQAIAQGLAVQASIRAYALRNARLPCPAVAADGYESRVGQACTAGLQQGFVPYVALGLPLPDQGLFAFYAVYRQPNADDALDADLTQALERTGDVAGDANFANSNDLVAALVRINPAAVNPASPFVTGDNSSAGVIDCATNRVSAAAYWVALPMQDANNDGIRLDASNSPTNLCATYPLAPLAAQFDDIVVADTPLQLAGWLKSWAKP